MIINIVDHRKNNKKFKEVYGVIEPTCNDNCCTDADQSVSDERIGFIEFTSKPMTLLELMKWANNFDGDNTLYIYSSDPMKVIKF